MTFNMSACMQRSCPQKTSMKKSNQVGWFLLPSILTLPRCLPGKKGQNTFPPLPHLAPPPSSLKGYRVAIFAHGKLIWLFPDGNRTLPCVHILCTPGGSEGITEGMENGETAIATEYQSQSWEPHASWSQEKSQERQGREYIREERKCIFPGLRVTGGF